MAQRGLPFGTTPGQAEEATLVSIGTVFSRVARCCLTICRCDLSFLAGLSLSIVALRVLTFDWNQFFQLNYISNHDMYQGASFFATSMQSIRLYGDIAWWNPLTNAAYAQYYQELFVPLAPTLGCIAFFLWAQFIWLLSMVGLGMTDYFQYLSVTYIVLPYLSTLAFAWLLRAFINHRLAVTLAVIVFGLSGIAIWDGA